MEETLIIILLLFMLGIFSWFGYTRMFIGMLVQFIMLVFAALVGNPDWLGDSLISFINRMWMLFSMMLNGGFQIIAGGDFGKLNEIYAVAELQPPLIRPQNREIVLFILMLLLIVGSFLAANKIRKKSSRLLGVFFGLVNGLMVIFMLLPVLGGGQGILPTYELETPLEGILGVFQLATRLLLTPVALVFEALGSWAIVVIILAIVIIAASTARGGKRSVARTNSSGSGNS